MKPAHCPGEFLTLFKILDYGDFVSRLHSCLIMNLDHFDVTESIRSPAVHIYNYKLNEFIYNYVK